MVNKMKKRIKTNLLKQVKKMSMKNKKRNKKPALTKCCGKVFRLSQERINT